MKGLKALAAVLLASGAAGGRGARHGGRGGLQALRRPAASRRTRNPRTSARRRRKKGAFFKSLNGDVVYTVCVKFPSGKNLCAQAQEAEQGTLYVNKITSTIPGKHVVSWFVKGKKVGSFAFTVTG